MEWIVTTLGVVVERNLFESSNSAHIDKPMSNQ